MEKRVYVYLIVLFLLAYLVAGVIVDSDNDGLPDDIEVSLGLDPNNPDSNGNGINDGDEIAFKMRVVDSGDSNSTGSGAADTTTDSDNDGLTDYEEGIIGTDPNNPDSDGDGLTDGAEFGHDSDNDGISDVVENQTGTDPNNPDSDSDGINDSDEAPANNKGGGGGGSGGGAYPGGAGAYPGKDFVFTQGPDSDLDGLSDKDEEVLGTDPLNPDTDNDTVGDLRDPDTYKGNISWATIIVIVLIALLVVVLIVLLVRKIFYH